MCDIVIKKINNAIRADRERERRHDEIMKKHEEERRLCNEAFAVASRGMLFRTATAGDYADWIWRYLENGGEISSYYDDDMPDDIYLARPFALTPLYGASAKKMIMPAEGKAIQPENIGHNTIFFDDGTMRGPFSSPPIYADVAAMLRRGVAK